MMLKPLVLLASLLVTASVFSGAALAKNPGRVAIAACSQAVTYEVRAMFPQAQRVQFLGSGALRQVSNAETGVSGRGQFDSYSGRTTFKYSCIYNLRNGATYAVNVRGGGSPHNGNDAAKVAGAVIGAAIATAIVESSHHNHRHHDGGGARDWFSPVPGVKCNTAQSACYNDNGTMAKSWTRKVFIDGEYAN